VGARRLPALDALGRGFANLRANRELVLVEFLGAIAILALCVAGLVPLLHLAGLTLRQLFALQATNPFTAAPFDPSRFDPARFLSPAAIGPLSILALALSVASLLWSWLQAGIFGILSAGERQAPPGPARPSSVFRTYRGRDFAGWANLFAWRFFLLLNLFGVFLLVLIPLFGLFALAVGLAGERAGAIAAVGVGCGGAIPLVFLLLSLAAAFGLAQADLAREASDVWRATRAGFRVLGRRLGGIVTLFGLYLFAVVIVSVVFGAVDLSLFVALRDRATGYAVAKVLLFGAQSIVSSVFRVAIAGTMVALVRHDGLEADRT